MDIRTKIYSTLSTIAAMTAIVACSEIDNVANGQYHGDGRITFSASTVAVDEGTMRAAGAKTQDMTSIAAKTDDGKTLYLHTTVTPIPVDSATHTMRGTKTESVASISDFGIKAYKTTNAFATDLTTSGTQHFDNVEASTADATPTTSSEWNTSTPYYWPDGTAKLSFFAYSPYKSTSPFGTSGGKVTLSYTANATVASQEDLLIAAAFDENHSASLDPKQSLTFKHALTAVTFEAAADLFPCTITKVSLSGIPTKNTYTYATAAGASYGTWGTTGSVGSEKTFEFDFTADGDDGKASTEGTLTSGANTLLMVPQTLPSGATATIEFTDAALRKHKLSYSLAGRTWEAGKQVKYTLSSSSITSIQIDFAEIYAQQSGSDALDATMPSFKTSFAASNEAVGLYIVDIVNHKIVGSNIKVNVSSEGVGTIETNGNLSTQSFLSDQTGKYKYFAYYPYKDAAGTYYTYTELTGLAAGNATTTTSEASAEAFFKDYIASWTPPTTQNTLAIIDQYDLQAGETTSISGGKLTIKLRHQMGLAAIAMGASVSGNVETLTLDGNTTTKKYNTTTNTTFYALDEFSDNLPYKVGTRNTANLRCYFLVNPAKTYTFSTTYKYGTTGQWNDFTVSSSSNTVQAGKYCVITTSTPKFKNLGRLYSYSATGRQDYTPILKDCKYQMECWGASGGKLYGQYETMSTGGRGGYTKGIITLTTARLTSYPTLYVYVGQKGSDWNGPDNPSASCPVAWNGGGTVTIYNACGGGGATDIRLSTGGATATTWNNSTSLASRIMVAGAGGGANDYGFGGAGGGLEGLIGKTSPANEGSTAGCGTGGTQIKGGTGQVSGGFGYGGTQTNFDGGAGGGGYYGGGQGTANGAGGGGGSSYISGLSGCATHSSGWTFDGAVTYSGTVAVYTASGPTGNNTTIPDPAKNEGNLLAYTKYSVHGYARIILKPYD